MTFAKRRWQQLQTQSGIADARGENWFAACKKLGVNPLTVHGEWQQGLSADHACGVQFAEVEVDTETGLVTVKKVLGVHDCGLIVNQNTLESQINGGIIMGMGYALYEERVMDDLSGVVLNPNFETYKLPGIADVPDIEIVLVNMPERGVIGIGEPATVADRGRHRQRGRQRHRRAHRQSAHHAGESFDRAGESAAGKCV